MKQVTLKDGTSLPVIKLTESDLPEITQLQTKVIEHLSEKTFLQPLTNEDFKYILEGTGVLVGVRAEGNLIAFRALLDPGEDPEHLGKDAGIPHELWSSVLYSEITNVDPAFRGNGLQRQLGKIVMEEIDTNQYKFVCTTVAPFNIASIKDKFELGMHIAALSVKYETLTRYIMMKSLVTEVMVSDDTSIEVGMGENEEQQKLLQSGWIGTSIQACEEGYTVVYRKMI
ncbi:GNAT family N-acetyltransferase [Sporosarcina sp. BI001-red]|uniref:GNAT family N-acetyltransferase n=1 Tax=Sporosarcina sp. BI001-red TaxID=2282866 RepID=UPI000E282ACA|nr:GNAT family N-acetyltransferase [Sporosarcina sp. BI001-red]REB06438.1 GNAT family N-acetyltransferase [Sporosarcina sp. BI001-red]